MIVPERRKADRAYLDANLWIPKSAINVEGVKRALTFTYFEGQGRTEKYLYMYRETKNHLQVPREFWNPNDFGFEVVDCRPQKYTKTKVRSRIHLDHRSVGTGLVPTGQSHQREAKQALLSSRGGILQLACGKGKTVVALDVIATAQVPALIIVDNTQLLKQWQESIEMFLEVPGGVGLIQADVFDWKKSVVLATYHTLAARADTMPQKVREWFGTIIWDEAHHVNAPTFSKTADLFYGRRFGLTATPKRDDGLHVIHEFHIGEILYRDLTQDLKPKIYFHWTGLEPDFTDQKVVQQTHAINGELNINKLAGYYGRWPARLQLITNRIAKRVQEGRKVLVLSLSVDELVNLLTIWNGKKDLYPKFTDLTAADVGETLDPLFLDPEEHEKLSTRLERIERDLKATPQGRRAELLLIRNEIDEQLKRHAVGKKIEKVVRQRQAEYRQSLLAMPSNAGLMIHKVDADERMRMLRERDVTFAIMKYGKEGLDEKSLDTVIACEPMSSRAVLQQVMGRIQRAKDGKKEPIFDIFEDPVGPMIGMCKKMRQHLRKWPVDEGGPYEYEFVGYPNSARKLR